MVRFFPLVYDMAMRPIEGMGLRLLRQQLLESARGEVLEIGSGTGVNYPFYHSVERVIAVEPDRGMLERSRKQNSLFSEQLILVQADAQFLPFADNTFDTVVACLVFCTISDPFLALQELQRVLKPDGFLLALEHVRIKNSWVSALQDGLTPLWKHLAGGCHLNRDTVSLIRKAGFQIQYFSSYGGGLFVKLKAQSGGVLVC